jgi:hypothetical protein
MSVIWRWTRVVVTANMQLGVSKVSHVNMDIQFSIESYHGVVKCWMSVDTHGPQVKMFDWLVWWLILDMLKILWFDD